MFVTSVFYHRERDLERKVTLRKLDHAAIYLLIAGTYTPVHAAHDAQSLGLGAVRRGLDPGDRGHCRED